MTDIVFTTVRGAYGWLGNMSPHPIELRLGGHLDGIWRTAEHLFQAHRFGAPAIVEEIRAAKSPMTAKLIAKKNAALMDVVPRSVADIGAMRLVLGMKLHEHPQLGELLDATGDAFIVEDVTARPNESGLFWGARRSAAGHTGPSRWVGTNTLGRLWMDWRASRRIPGQLRSQATR